MTAKIKYWEFGQTGPVRDFPEEYFKANSRLYGGNSCRYFNRVCHVHEFISAEDEFLVTARNGRI
ncbi:hypothetical protein TcasGA2_TC013426 [Tribolium castaneum]|uniref:Uncharacterized protein n=1 Tax=Tribolium castaneum TaxID=7070 RepID=D6WLK6_TRICA|nr:hypothetical protein TcasGA2_TC013426 [Tribolium castaneum]